MNEYGACPNCGCSEIILDERGSVRLIAGEVIDTLTLHILCAHCYTEIPPVAQVVHETETQPTF
jgi:hypothetical protein